MKTEELKATAEGLTYAYKRGFKDAVEIFDIDVDEKVIDEIINDADAKSREALIEKFGDDLIKN